MREQIEELIEYYSGARHQLTLAEAAVAHIEAKYYLQGQRLVITDVIDRLRAILASPDAVSAEKGADGSL